MKLVTLTKVLALPALLSVAACSFKEEDGNADKFREPIPTKEQVSLDTGSSSSGSSTQSAPGVGTQAPTSSGLATFYLHTRTLFDGINLGTSYVFGLTHLVTAYPPTTLQTSEAIWGPWSEDLSPAEWRMRVTEVEKGKFEYAWEGRKKGSKDEFRATLIGTGYAKSDARHGKGTFTIDYDTANDLDPGRLGRDETSGKTVVDHDITWVNNTFGPTNIHVVGKPSTREGATFDITLVRNGQGKGGDLRLVAHDDLDDSKKTAMEDLVMHSRWAGTGAGRADVLLSGGDLPTTVSMVKISECWGTDFKRTYYTDDASIEAGTGDESVCAFATAEF